MSQAVERSILGMILLAPDQVLTACRAADVGPSDFALDDHAELYRLFTAIAEEGVLLDPTIAIERVWATGQPVRYGGLELVCELPEKAPPPASAASYIAELVELSGRRRAREVAQRVLADLDAGRPTDVVVAHAQESLVSVRGRVDTRREAETSANAVVWRALDRIQAQHGSAAHRPLMWPWDDANRVTAGILPGELVILAARPSMGKTAIVQQLARFHAGQGRVVVVYNYEGIDESVVMRHLSGARIDPHRLRMGLLEPSEIRRLQEHAVQVFGGLAGQHLHIVSADHTMPALEADVVQRQQRGQDVALVVVDYLQLVPPTERSAPREQQVARITAGLRSMANRLRLPVVALAQLNRELEKRADKRPVLADLRESGSLEQEADMVLFVHREGYYEGHDTRSGAGEAELICAKHRNYQTGTAKLWFQAGLFSDQTRGER